MRSKYIVLIFCLLGSQLRAQLPFLSNEQIADKVRKNKDSISDELLFLHTDKTIYTNNETIWFSAYLIRSSSVELHTILTIALIKEDSRIVELVSKHKMENGLSFGSVTLPDSIPPGNYQIVATTNILAQNGLPHVMYQQPVTIKSITQTDFKASLSLLDSGTDKKFLRALITIDNTNSKLKERPNIEYRIGNGPIEKTNLKDNTFLMSIPLQNVSNLDPVLFVTVKLNNQVQYLSVKIPLENKPDLSVKFFPEGGHLVKGIQSKVEWETRTTNGKPIQLKAVLYENDLPIDTCSTNFYGLGSFKLKPMNENSYHLRILGDSLNVSSNEYKLPNALETGIVIQVANAVATDTLSFILLSPNTRSVQVIVHNFKEVFAAFETITSSSGRPVKIALPALPKGIATITIVDQVGRPLAERMFFAHHEQGINTIIKTDKKEYDRREKVNVTIQVNDHSGKPVQGIISVAAIQANRIENGKEQDIESYVYITHDLGSLPNSALGRNIHDKDYLEDIFLIRSWSRYTWPNLLKADSAAHLKINPRIQGTVRYNNRALKKSIAISVTNQPNFEILTTDQDGSFELDPQKLIVKENQRVILSVNQRDKEGYTFHLKDPFLEINKKLARKIDIADVGFNMKTTDHALTGIERMILLSEVVVTDSKSTSSLYAARAKGPNACGDYVDEWGYLNYPYSANNSKNYQPVKGKEYKIRTDIKGDGPGSGNTFSVRRIVYEGCTNDKNDGIFKLDGIYLAREFYGVSPLPESFKEPQFLSTLFWQPGIVTNATGHAELSFVTGDITGAFRIIVQGVSDTYVLYGKDTFTVKK
ncbi:MAG TPA: hypothetical protein VNI52_07570 [Sphingobacteriaceae bacterium]|nr:hypothetical protein [Sphingobacteriaceae bacterium]